MCVCVCVCGGPLRHHLLYFCFSVDGCYESQLPVGSTRQNSSVNTTSPASYQRGEILIKSDTWIQSDASMLVTDGRSGFLRPRILTHSSKRIKVREISWTFVFCVVIMFSVSQHASVFTQWVCVSDPNMCYDAGHSLEHNMQIWWQEEIKCWGATDGPHSFIVWLICSVHSWWRWLTCCTTSYIINDLLMIDCWGSQLSQQ